MRKRWAAYVILGGVAVGAVSLVYSGETPDTILIRKTLSDEVTGWRTGNLDLIRSAYVPQTFVGYEGYGRMDPTTWKVSFSTLDEFTAFCRERLKKVKYAMSRNPLYFDVRGDRAWVVTEEEGTRIDRATGAKTAFRDTTELWMLEKVEDEWKITRFVRHLHLRPSTPPQGRGGGAVSEPLQKEAEGWASSDEGKILSAYDADEFVGLEAYGKDKPTVWKVTFKAFDEWKAFCTKRLDRTQYTISDHKMVYADVKGDQALAVTHRRGKAVHRQIGGPPLTFNDYDLWMLKRVGEQWKIIGFIRRFPWPGTASEG